MNIEDLITQYASQADAARTRMERARQEITAILDHAKARGASNLTKAEDSQAELLLETADKAKAELRDAESALAKAQAIKADDDAYVAQSQVSFPTAAATRRQGSRGTSTVRIGSEPKTYRAQAERTRTNTGEEEPGFLQDLYRMQVLGDPSAAERIQRHGNEMAVDNPGRVKRAVGSGGVPGFLPPEYLEQYFAEFARAGRPLANLCNRLPLPPEGMSVNIPRVTTSTLTAVQAADNAAIGNQDPASTLLTVPVNTIGGYVVASRQSLVRGPFLESTIVADLAADYNARLDLECVNGSGSSGHHLGILGVSGINAVTFTSASPTPQLMWPKLASAVGQVLSGRFTGPNAIVMTPTEWAWLLSSQDSTGRPFVEPAGVALNPVAVSSDGPASYSGVAGYLFGVPIILDGNVPANLGAGTNETRVIVADFRDVMLFEENGGAPSQLRFEQPSAQTLGVLLIAYGYTAFAAGRQPKAVSVVAGTGMITPAL